MPSKYRCYWPGNTNAADVRLADPKHFPLRDTMAEAVQDVQDAWHKPSHWEVACHLTVYEIREDGSVQEWQPRVKRGLVAVKG